MITPAKNSHDRVGLVPGVANLAIESVDRAQITTIGIMQDVRTELRVALDNGVELAEKTVLAMFRLTKKLVARIDEAAAGTLGSAEKLLGSAVKHAKDTSDAATELANTAIDGITGSRIVS